MDADTFFWETINEVEERIREYKFELAECELTKEKTLEMKKDIIEYTELLIKLRSIA